MANMLAEDGRCKTLDANADGYVRGEAVQTVAAVNHEAQLNNDTKIKR